MYNCLPLSLSQTHALILPPISLPLLHKPTPTADYWPSHRLGLARMRRLVANSRMS